MIGLDLRRFEIVAVAAAFARHRHDDGNSRRRRDRISHRATLRHRTARIRGALSRPRNEPGAFDVRRGRNTRGFRGLFVRHRSRKHGLRQQANAREVSRRHRMADADHPVPRARSRWCSPPCLPAIAFPALLVSAFLMFVARPVAVYIGPCEATSRYRKERSSCRTGLRGAVPVVLATFPFTAGYEHSDMLFNMVFFIVLTSVLLQGKSLMAVARWLKVDQPLVSRPRYPLEFEKTESGMMNETRETDILRTRPSSAGGSPSFPAARRPDPADPAGQGIHRPERKYGHRSVRYADDHREQARTSRGAGDPRGAGGRMTDGTRRSATG